MTFIKSHRKFLNNAEQGGTAFVAFRVRLAPRGYLDGEFTIKDCSTEATLEFFVPTAVKKGKPRIENARAKIALLKEAIDEFEKAFEEGLVERDKARRKKRKK